jgi:hypothetical protein
MPTKGSRGKGKLKGKIRLMHYVIGLWSVIPERRDPTLTAVHVSLAAWKLQQQTTDT